MLAEYLDHADTGAQQTPRQGAAEAIVRERVQ